MGFPSLGRTSRFMPQAVRPIPAKRAEIEAISTDWPRGARNANGPAMSDQSSSETALVLFSGGQDSTTCLAWALQRFARVEMLGFGYGQRHAIELECRDRLLVGHQIAAAGLGGKARREPYAGDSDAGRDFRHRADARCRDRHGRGRPAQHLRARPQPGVPHLRRGAGLPARHPPHHRRHVRDRLFRLSGLPRRDHQGAADRAQSRHGEEFRTAHAADVARQGLDLEAGA